MTLQERLARLSNPPPGSKLRAAQDYGFDLTLYRHSLELTPEERLRELQSAQPFLDELRRKIPILRKGKILP